MSLHELLVYITQNWVSATKETFRNHELANIFRGDFKDKVTELALTENNDYIIKASVGAGQWASIPWLSILDPDITNTTSTGIYPVYLFCEDGSGVYLSLGFGTTALKREHGTRGAKIEAGKIQNRITQSINQLKNWNSQIELKSSTALGRSYEWATAGAKFYPKDNIPSESILKSDLLELLNIYKEVKLVTDVNSENISTLSITALSKPFLLLAGISGTGKTRFIKKQAEAVDSNHDNYCLTSVRPDWHEPSDLLGYVSRLGTQPEYVITDVLEFMVKAWIEIEKNGITINGDTSEGNQEQQQQVRPFWLCLDEMNLAPVEQYFADYLSVIETREWAWENNKFVYSCKPLLKPSLFKDIEKDTLKKALGLTDHETLWQHFLKNGISIPFNLIVAGTVNMDETTHGFSRKVIDRALTFDFGEFFPNNFDEFFEPKNEPKVLSYPVWSDGRNKAALAETFDSDGALSIALLESINTVLHNTPFKLAYRALNELLLSVMTNKPSTDIELQAVWDDFMMCKVLPRVEGDIDKLSKGGEDKNIIEQLEVLLSKQLSTIWDGKTRPDLYRKSLENEMAIVIECRSKAKLKWMNDQLANGFTSFWP